MKKFDIEIGHYKIDYYIADVTCDVFDRLGGLETDCFYIIYDLNIGQYYIELLVNLFSESFHHKFIGIKTSEINKNMENIQLLLERLMREGVTRNSCLIALGGGVIGNMVGLIANLLFRGIKFVHMPTTFLAASDSVLSLKQAVNSTLGKNTFGTYYKPEMILMDFNNLKSLPKRDYNSGVVELIKNLLSIIPEDLTVAYTLLNSEVEYTYQDFVYMMELSIKAKSNLLIQDMYEKKDGLIFEYGHTVGHAVEFLTNGEIKHGEAVAFGMLVAGEISYLCGFLSEEDLQIHYQLLHRIGVLKQIQKNLLTLNNNQIIDILQYDNKRGYFKRKSNVYPFVLLSSLGVVHRHKGSILTPVSAEVLNRSISRSLEKMHVNQKVNRNEANRILSTEAFMER